MTHESALDLPPGWALARVAELVAPNGIFSDGDWVESKDQDAHGDVRLIQLADIGDGAFHSRSARFLTTEKARQLRCTFLELGDVLVARMPDPLGRACVFPGDEKKAVTVVDVCIIRTGAMGPDHHWLVYAINAPQTRGRVEALQKGTTRKRISRGNLATIPLALPPLPEQQRIVAEIEKHFTRLDAAVAALERARARLKRYRAAVLKAACEGRLVPTEAELARQEGRDYEPAEELLVRILEERRAKWETDERTRIRARGRAPTQDSQNTWKLRYGDLPAPDMTNLPFLREGWCWSTVGQLSHKVTDGTHSTPAYVDHGVPFISVNNILERGYIDFSTAKFITAAEHAMLIKRCCPEPGDILLSKVGTVGLTAVVPAGRDFSLFVNTALVKPVRSSVISEYLALSLRGGFLAGRYAHLVGGSTQQFIGIGAIATIPVPLPPLAEQQRIVAEVERRLSVVDQLEAAVAAAIKRAARLRQAILKRAFEGKLVSQDPADEPASVLLERIRAEREQSGADGRAPASRRRTPKRQARSAAAQLALEIPESRPEGAKSIS